MTIAVMQPYIFPYIGYFQMIDAVDKFVFYDDVNYIKQGWINRNRILVSGKDMMFTIPLQKANSFCLIKDTLINPSFYEPWKLKFRQTITQNYKRAPEYEAVSKLIDSVFNQEYISISELAIESIKSTSSYLGLNTEFLISSQAYQNKSLERTKRLLNICKIEKTSRYINALGGQELYKKEDFLAEDIELNFIKSLPVNYKQFNNEFVPGLSILDVLMFNSVKEVKDLLSKFTLI